MDTGYDPARIALLGRRTVEAIVALGRFQSTDPAAADTMRTIRLTRRNLEDHWITAVRDIEHSQAMFDWRTSGLRSLATTRSDRIVRLFGLRGSGVIAIPDARRDDLLARLDWLERTALNGDHEPGAPSDADLEAIADQLASWVTRDPAFAAELVERSVSNMTIGRLLGTGTFPLEFAAAVVRRMAVPNGPDSGVDRGRYAASLSTALTALTSDPVACLDLLLDQPTVYALAAWDALDTSTVADVVVSGLHVAVVADPSRYPDGIRVLEFLTRAATGPLDHGFGPGMSLGLARSLTDYASTFVAASSSTTIGARVAVHETARDVAVDFGTREDVLGLFGSILRTPSARTELRSAVATWTDESMRDPRTFADFRLGVIETSTFVTLVVDAADAEHAQVLADDAAEDVRNRRVGEGAAFVADKVAASLGAPGVVSGTLGPAIVGGAVWLGAHDIDDVRVAGLGEDINRQMAVVAISIGLVRPGFFPGSDTATAITPSERRDVSRKVDQVRNARDATRRAIDFNTLQATARSIPALVPAATAIDLVPEAHELHGR